MGLAFTIFFLIAAGIWLLKEYCDPSYQSQQQNKRKMQEKIDQRNLQRKSKKEQLLSEGYRTVSYEVCKKTLDNYYEDLREEVPQIISRMPDGYFPLKSDFPNDLTGPSFFTGLRLCGSQYLFNQDKIIEEFNLNFGPWPDPLKDKKELCWGLSVCKYASMSNRDFEKAIGRKLSFQELTNRMDLIFEMFPPFDTSYDNMYGGKKCYPINNPTDNAQIIYDFYGGDTGSTEEDFANLHRAPVRLKTPEEKRAERWAEAGGIPGHEKIPNPTDGYFQKFINKPEQDSDK